MATFSVRFLGCKVSHTDAHEIRERLLLDGHSESVTQDGDIAVVNTCCVTNEAVSRQPRRRRLPGFAGERHRRREAE